MKFYSVSIPDYGYTCALSLSNIRGMNIVENSSTRNASRFSVRLEYRDGVSRSFNYLTEEKARKVYQEILTLLNNRG